MKESTGWLIFALGALLLFLCGGFLFLAATEGNKWQAAYWAFLWAVNAHTVWTGLRMVERARARKDQIDRVKR